MSLNLSFLFGSSIFEVPDKQIETFHKTSYLASLIKQAFLKVRIIEDADAKQAGEFLAGLYLSMSRLLLPEIVEKIFDYIDPKTSPRSCEFVGREEKMWKGQFFGQVIWMNFDNRCKFEIIFFNGNQPVISLAEEQGGDQPLVSLPDVQTADHLKFRYPSYTVVKPLCSYEVANKAYLYEHTTQSALATIYPTRIPRIGIEFVPQWVSLSYTQAYVCGCSLCDSLNRCL